MKKTNKNLAKNSRLNNISNFTKNNSFLYKILLATRPNENGTALGVALGFGFLIFLLGTLTIIRSSTDQTNATVNEKAVQTQAVTDIATSRALAFLAKYPAYAENANNVWAAVPTTSGAAQGTYTVGTGGSSGCSAATGNNSGGTVAYADLIGQKLVNNSDATEGGFELASYTLTNVAGQPINYSTTGSPAVIQSGVTGTTPTQTYINDLKNAAANNTPFAYGIITLKGAVNSRATDAATNFSGNESSKSQIQVRIPLIKRPPNEIPFAGLWLNNQTANSRDQVINANLMVKGSDCAEVTLDMSSGNQVIISDATMPSLPYLPVAGATGVYQLSNTSSVSLPISGNVPDSNGVYHYFTNRSLSQVTISPSLPTGQKVYVYNEYTSPGTTNSQLFNDTLPNVAQDKLSSDGVYRYIVDKIGDNGNNNVNITTGHKVHVYLKGNMEFAGNGSVVYNCDGQLSTFGGQPCKVSDFRIYAYADSTVLAGAAPLICISGGPTSQGFILGPNYSGGVNGGGGGVSFTGALWIGQWAGTTTTPSTSCGSASNSGIVVKQATNMDWDAIGLYPENLPAKVNSVSTRTRQNYN